MTGFDGKMNKGLNKDLFWSDALHIYKLGYGKFSIAINNISLLLSPAAIYDHFNHH